MFEADLQIRTDAGRSLGFGTSRLRGLEALPGTIYGEIKLSDRLSREVFQLRAEVKSLNLALKQAEQKTESALIDSQHYKTRCAELQESLTMLHFHATQTAKSSDLLHFTETQLTTNLKTIMESYAVLEAECKAKNTLLQDQYALIDKLKTKETSQDHMCALLQMQNDIIGERLKGLYSSIETAVSNRLIESTLSNEIKLLYDRGTELANFLEKVTTEIDKVTMMRDKMVEKCEQMIVFRDEMKAERDRIGKIAKDKIGLLQGQLQKCEEEKEKLTSELSKTEQNFKDLTDEYEKLRQKAKQYKLKRKMYGEEDEKVCKNCQRVFIESENYNWSCRRHQSEYSGEIYWCCGKSGKDTPGCKISRHESKEEDEEAEDLGKVERDPSSMHCSVTSIQSCKKLGHSACDCPRDPNIRTAFDISEEVQRVTDVIESKKKEDQFSATLALEVMTQRSDLYQFNNPDADSSGTESQSSDSESEQPKKHFFYDIARMKRSMLFDTETVRCMQNLVQFETMQTKETDVRSKSRHKTSSVPHLRLIVPSKLSAAQSPVSYGSFGQFPSDSSQLEPSSDHK